MVIEDIDEVRDALLDLRKQIHGGLATYALEAMSEKEWLEYCSTWFATEAERVKEE